MTEFNDLLDAIEVSPILEREQKLLLIAAIEAGEPYSEELVNSIFGFLQASLRYLEVEQKDMEFQLEEISKEIQKLDAIPPEEIQKKARQVITLVNNFLVEIKKIDQKFDTEMENVVKTDVEGGEIQNIRQFLGQHPSSGKSPSPSEEQTQ